ncbi:MAG TPA: Gfo/Idh/MocA family oxidoreductase, partial [Candidatus Agrococcus pullicola]|nr:Gfo/Idh/MocA family oxidoreductase [Candidatus Agrococcus pullicola]
MSEQPLGVAIVGVGGIALEHMTALRSTNLANLVAVFDLDTDRAEEIAHVERCEHFSDLDAMLRAELVEAVIVCTPNITHAELGRKVLRAGKHLLMEKPLAMTDDDAQDLVDLAEERELTLAVGHSHRFSDQGVAIDEAIRAGAVGTPRFIRVVINGGWIWPGWQAWVLNPELSGGHSMHNGVHLTDMASWWLGEKAESVFSVGQHATSAAMGIYDYLAIELGFPSGASAVLEVSRGERPRSANYLEITVVGSEGVLTREWDAQGVLAWTEEGSAAWGTTGSGARTFVREMESFVAAARGDAPVVPPLEFAIHAVAVAQASERSLATGTTVRLAESTSDQSGK